MIYNKKSIAQGTIEYLVIIAVVVVISLIVVGLFVTLIDSPSQEITDSSSQIGNVAVGGISIVEAVIDYDGDSLIRISNNSSDAITLTRISVGGADNNFSEQLVGLDSKVFSLSALNSNCSCVRGQKSVKCEIKIISTTANGNPQTDYKTINAQCVTKSTSTNPTTVVDPIVPVLELGTLANPWIINDCDELQAMNEHLDGNYILGNDIDCSDTINWDDEIGFLPIGDNINYFIGNFNGMGYEINDLFVNRTYNNFVGLFGYSSGNISNVGLVDVNINGSQFVGGLIGQQYLGSITDSYSIGVVTGFDNVGGLVGSMYSGDVSGSYSTGSVLGLSSYVGGLMGYQYAGTVSDSYSTGTANGVSRVGGLVGFVESGDVFGSYSTVIVNGLEYVGGLVGFVESGDVSGSYSTGSVFGSSSSVGGLVGYQSLGTISDSYSIGNATGNSYVGGFVGYQYLGTISNSYSIGFASGSSSIGGLLGDIYEGSISSSYWDMDNSELSTSAGGVGKTTAQMKAQTTFTGWDFDTIWDIEEGVSYPTLK